MFIFTAITPLYAQRLRYKNDNEQEYSVGVSPTEINNSLSVSLCYYKNKTTGLDIWSFDFVVIGTLHPFSFDKGSLLLMETNPGVVLEFIEAIEHKDVKSSEKRVSSIQTLYYAVPTYMASEEYLNTIISDGIKKIRFDSTGGYIDINLTNNAFSDAIKKQKDIIIEESCFNRDF